MPIQLQSHIAKTHMACGRLSELDQPKMKRMNRFASIFLTLVFLVSGAANAGGLDFFDRAASLALSGAAKSAEKGVELDTEKRAIADPSQAESIRSTYGVVRDGLQSASGKLFDLATGNERADKAQLRGKHTLPSKSRSTSRRLGKDISHPLEKGEMEVGIYGEMTGKRNSIPGTEVHHIPSVGWLKLRGLDPSMAVGIRMSKKRHGVTQTHGFPNSRISSDERDHSFKDVVVRDLKDLRAIYLEAGVPDEEIKAKMIEIIKLTNVVYADVLKKPRWRNQ